MKAEIIDNDSIQLTPETDNEAIKLKKFHSKHKPKNKIYPEVCGIGCTSHGNKADLFRLRLKKG